MASDARSEADSAPDIGLVGLIGGHSLIGGLLVNRPFGQQILVAPGRDLCQIEVRLCLGKLGTLLGGGFLRLRQRGLGAGQIGPGLLVLGLGPRSVRLCLGEICLLGVDIGAGLLHGGLRLGHLGTGLGHLLVHIGRGDGGEKLPGLDFVANVGVPPLHIPGSTRNDSGLLDGLNVAWQVQIIGSRRRLHARDTHGGSGVFSLFRVFFDLRPAQQARDEADEQQHGQHGQNNQRDAPEPPPAAFVFFAFGLVVRLVPIFAVAVDFAFLCAGRRAGRRWDRGAGELGRQLGGAGKLDWLGVGGLFGYFFGRHR